MLAEVHAEVDGPKAPQTKSAKLLALLSLAMRTLPLGTAYTIWTGIGAIGAFLVGILVLGEQVTAMRMLAAVLIVSGLVLMKLSSSH